MVYNVLTVERAKAVWSTLGESANLTANGYFLHLTSYVDDEGVTCYDVQDDDGQSEGFVCTGGIDEALAWLAHDYNIK